MDSETKPRNFVLIRKLSDATEILASWIKITFFRFMSGFVNWRIGFILENGVI